MLTPEDLTALASLMDEKLRGHSIDMAMVCADAVDSVLRELIAEYDIRKPRSKAAVRQARYRGRKVQTNGTHTAQDWMDRVNLLGWKCRYCSKGLDENSLQKEHQIPVSRGGSNWPANLVPACKSCNSSKGSMTPREFYAAKIQRAA